MKTDKLDELVNYINNKSLDKDCLVVGIDGKDGVGKSTLTHKINSKLKGKIIGLDNFLEKNREKYIDHIKFKEVKEDIEIFKRENNILIVEGICLLAILNRIGVRCDILIYVKRVSKYGQWLDDSICDYEERDIEEILSDIDNMEELSRTPGAGNLDREIVKYHFKYKPLEKATCIFIIKEE